MNTGMNWLKSRREQLQISQEELAKRLQLAGFDVSRAAVSGWETSRFNPPLGDHQFRVVLAKHLQMSIVALLAEAGYETESNHTPAGDRGASIIDNLPPERQKLALDLLDVLARS